jgi:hypothetical protein
VNVHAHLRVLRRWNWPEDGAARLTEGIAAIKHSMSPRSVHWAVDAPLPGRLITGMHGFPDAFFGQVRGDRLPAQSARNW